MQKLKNKGYSIGLLTARSWHRNALEVTKNLVEKHNLPVDIKRACELKIDKT